MIIALVSKIGAGKGTAADYLSGKGFKILVFSDVLKEELEKQGKEINRENLQKLGSDLKQRFGNDILARKLSEKISSGDYILDGLRHPDELQFLREKYGKKLLLIGIVCDRKIRFERIKVRSTRGEKELMFEEFLKKDSTWTEIYIDELIKNSDIRIDNNGNVEKLYEQIDNILKTLGG